MLHEDLAIVAPAAEQGRQGLAQLPGVEGGLHGRVPLAAPGGLPVGQEGLLGLVQGLVQVAAVVVEDLVGVQQLLGARALGVDAVHGPGGVEAVPLHQALEADLLRGVHHPQRVEDVGLAPLDPEGGVQHHALDVGGQRAELVGQAGLDEGVEDGLQALPAGGFGEHQAGHLLPVQGARVREDAVAEGLHQGGQARGAGLHHLARHLVGVDDLPAQNLQAPGCVGLAGGDAPREAHDGVGGLHQALVEGCHGRAPGISGPRTAYVPGVPAIMPISYLLAYLQALRMTQAA